MHGIMKKKGAKRKSSFRAAASCALLLALGGPAAGGTLTVVNNADAGAGSLRQAIADATTGDTIVFDAGLQGSTITLTTGALTISNKTLSIRGPGPDRLSLNGGGSSRVFYIANAVSGTRTVTLSGLSITNGLAASGGGGGIRTAPAFGKEIALTLSNCVVRANQSATATYEGGGGVAAARYTTLTMVDCEVSSNGAAQYGGGGVWVYGPATFDRVSFVGNTSAASGGGLLIRNGLPVVIRNCTFSGNVSTYNDWNDAAVGGGALFTQEGGSVSIYNTTVTGNSATKRCGGIRSQGTTSMVLWSVIAAGNSDTKGTPDVYGTFTGVTNCLIQVTGGVSLPGANNLVGVSAQLEPLARNGGPTRTHALQSTSPAIGKGINPLGLAFDQRGAGFPRVLGLAADIGAYEFLPPPNPGTVFCLR